jgi:hypothetical protein
MFNFSPEKTDVGSRDLIPAGTLLWFQVGARGIKNSQSTGGEYADLELTVMDSPNGSHNYGGRKIFTNVMSPYDERVSEAGRGMGFAAVLHMVESAGLVNINDPNSYAPLNTATFLQVISALDGKAVAAKVSVQKDKGGAYPDKNQIGEWLSPNPTRGSAFKGYQALAEGRHTLRAVAPAPAPQQQSFSGFAGAPAPAAQSGLQAPVASLGGGFGQPPAAGAPQTAPKPPAPQTPNLGASAQPPAFLGGGQQGGGGVPF